MPSSKFSRLRRVISCSCRARNAPSLALTLRWQGPLKLYSGLSAGLFRQITYFARADVHKNPLLLQNASAFAKPLCFCKTPLLLRLHCRVTSVRRYTMPRLGLFDQFKTIAAKHNGGNIEVRFPPAAAPLSSSSATRVVQSPTKPASLCRVFPPDQLPCRRAAPRATCLCLRCARHPREAWAHSLAHQQKWRLSACQPTASCRPLSGGTTRGWAMRSHAS